MHVQVHSVERGAVTAKASSCGTAIERVISLVCREKNVPVQLLLHHSRCRADVALARQLAMYLANVALGQSFTSVGRRFGRDRTTVSHACALVEDMREDPGFEMEVSRLEFLLETMDGGHGA